MSVDIKVMSKGAYFDDFDRVKIFRDIDQSVREAVGDDSTLTTTELTNRVVNYIQRGVDDGAILLPIDTDDVQNCIENCLMGFDREIAKAYIKRHCRKELIDQIASYLGLRG